MVERFAGNSPKGANQNRTGDLGVADPCLTAWLWRLTATMIIPRFSFLWQPLWRRNLHFSSVYGTL